MGNFLSKAWKSITGQKQADKANQMQQQALSLQQAEADRAQKLREQVLGQYDELMPMIMSLLKGEADGSNPMAAQSYQTTQKLLNQLTGNEVTPEQAQYDELSNNIISMLTNPTGDRKAADNLIDQYVNQLTGKTKTPEQQTADDWNTKYLNSLANNSDVAFNAGVSELARGIQTQNENIAKAMQNRGISSSGINVAALGSTAADKARGMSQLQGQRVDRQVNNNAIGAQYAQGLANQNLNNMGTAASLLDTKSKNTLANYGTAVDVAGNKADKNTNDLMSALNIGNNWNQQAWNNVMSLLGSKTSLINNQAGNNYVNGLNNLAGQYQQQAASRAGTTGNIIGGLLGLTTGGIGGLLGGLLGNKYNGNG